ncbi:MAG: hypothetical protein J5831_01850 [Bacteroidales bacterium]|nr:hypothetical protein [Bacteroidales bacterium]
MRKTVLFVLLALLGICPLPAQTPGEGFDVNHYEIRLWDFNFSQHTLQGEAFIDVTVTAPTDTFVLELKSLTVTDAATESYGVASFSQEGDLLTIVTDEVVGAGETMTLDVRYGGNTFNESWGGVHWWGNYVYNLGVGFESQPHNLGKTWFPCVDNFTDKASYSLYLTVTNDKKAICGGNLVNVFDNGDGTSTWHWETSQEIATYHISFTIGDYVKWEDTYHGVERDIPVEVYVKPSQINSVPGTFVHVKDIAAAYENWFGPYPFNRIGYICTGQGCMEHIDNIAVTSGVITGNTTQEEYVAHELSHMYFGNRVTCDDASDMWLNEGFAQFIGMFFRTAVYGEDDFQSKMRPTMNSIVTWCRNQNNWIPLNAIPLDMTYDSKAVYDRGAVIANTMMNYMGKEAFLEGLRHYLNTYAYGAASSEQLRDALTEATGIDMGGFFDTYVFTAGVPHYGIEISDVVPNGDQYDVKLQMHYQHIGPSHVGQDNRVEITFACADGSLQTEMAHWSGVEGEQAFTLSAEPLAVCTDYANHFHDAKFDKNLTATGPGSLSQSDLLLTVKSVTDSVRLRIEAHLVAPEDDPEIPYLTLSTRHYWKVLRQDFGPSEIEGKFDYHYGASYDGDIIHTANDSVVLLYRANLHDPWHTIPYTVEGTWKVGTFTVNDPMTGEYTVGVIDKALLGLDETAEAPRLFPNPAHEEVTLRWNGNQSGLIHLYNAQLQLVKTHRYQHCDQTTFPVNDLVPGLYFIEHQGTLQKLIVM